MGDETLHYLHYGKMLDEPQQAQLVVLHQLVVQLSKCDGATMTHQFVCALTPCVGRVVVLGFSTVEV